MKSAGYFLKKISVYIIIYLEILIRNKNHKRRRRKINNKKTKQNKIFFKNKYKFTSIKD